MSDVPERFDLPTGPPGPGHSSSVNAALTLEATDSVGSVPTGTVPADGVPAAARPPFEAVYDELFDFVWRSARRLGVPDGAADDVVQDVFVVVHRRLGDFEGRSSLRTWVFAIVLRVVSDWRRTQRRKGGLSSLDQIAPHGEVPDDRTCSPHMAAERAEAVALLHALLDELEDDKRTVFVLAELEQASAPEIAEMVGIPLNTVYSRLRAARADFERALSRYRARQEHVATGRRRHG